MTCGLRSGVHHEPHELSNMDAGLEGRERSHVKKKSLVAVRTWGSRAAPGFRGDRGGSLVGRERPGDFPRARVVIVVESDAG